MPARPLPRLPTPAMRPWAAPTSARWGKQKQPRSCSTSTGVPGARGAVSPTSRSEGSGETSD
eukprot:7748379-Lingulodinium_polyedra.AAC.1